MNIFHRRQRLVLPVGEESGPITLEQMERLTAAGNRPEQTGVTRGRLEGFLGNPLGYGQTVSLAEAEEILGKDCVVSYAQASNVWLCQALDPGCVPYSMGLLQTVARLNESGRVIRLVYLFNLPITRQLDQQGSNRISSPRFTEASRGWITKRGQPFFSPQSRSGYWLVDLSISRFDQVSDREIASMLAEALPRERWAEMDTVSQALISIACADPREELRPLAEKHYHKSPPKTFADRWLVGNHHPRGLTAMPLNEVEKDPKLFKNAKIGVVTLIAR